MIITQVVWNHRKKNISLRLTDEWEELYVLIV